MTNKIISYRKTNNKKKNNFTGASLNPLPDNTRLSSHNSNSQNPENPPPFIFGEPPKQQQNYGNIYPQVPPAQPYPGVPNYPNPYNNQQYPYGGQQYPQNPYGGQQYPQNPYGGQQYPNNNYRPTKEPSLLDQFLYNKRGGKNGSSSLNPSFLSVSFGVIALVVYQVINKRFL